MTEELRDKRILIADVAKVRLDKYLATRFPVRSRRFWQNLIKAGKVTVDNKCVKPDYNLKGKEYIVIEFPPPEPAVPQPEEIPLNIIYEDSHLLTVNKPPGLVVHPAAGNKEHTLVNAILHHCPDMELSGSTHRPGIVHRLDKDTSGIMVVTKTHRAYLNLVQQIANRELKRRYRALVVGTPVPAEGKIDLPIGRHPLHRTKMAVNLINGKPALTFYKTIERFWGISLLDVSLHTGRTHQIRVHLSHLGFPVLGDQQYGLRPRQLASVLTPDVPEIIRNALITLKRQMLHSYYLKLRHPSTGEEMEFNAPLAEDFDRLLTLLRKG